MISNYSSTIYPWTSTVRKIFSLLSKPQAQVLALFSIGISWARSCTLCKVAEKLSFMAGFIPTVERRLQRFLSNPAVDIPNVSVDLARWVLNGLFAQPRLLRRKYLILLVDEVPLGQHLKVMCVAVAYRHRAIPLAWWCYRPDQYPLPQVELINRLLDQVAPALPPKAKVLVQADRGLGCSPDLLALIVQRGWYFLVRVQKDVQLKLPDGRQVSFGDMVPKPGRRLWNQELMIFKKAGWFSYRALGYWKIGSKEPWLLVTNCPDVAVEDYRIRMWQEHAFRDLKSNGFGWDRSRVRKPDHAERLWLALALAYAWAMKLGSEALERPALWHRVAGADATRISIFQVGVRLLNELLEIIINPNHEIPVMQFRI